MPVCYTVKGTWLHFFPYPHHFGDWIKSPINPASQLPQCYTQYVHFCDVRSSIFISEHVNHKFSVTSIYFTKWNFFLLRMTEMNLVILNLIPLKVGLQVEGRLSEPVWWKCFKSPNRQVHLSLTCWCLKVYFRYLYVKYLYFLARMRLFFYIFNPMLTYLRPLI